MAIQVYEGQTPLFKIRGVLNATMSDKLTGETAFSFSTLASKALQLQNGQIVQQDKMIYRVVRVAKSLANALPTVTAECEHVSYELNNEEYNLVTFVFEGYPIDGLTEILDGTPFTVGEVEETVAVECAFTDGTLTRRDALMRFADACGCEVEYDEYTINLRKHRGSIERIELMDGKNVTAISSTEEAREGTTSFEVTLYKLVTLQAGDEIHIKFTPLNIDVETRIVGIEYDPFNPYIVRVEVGDYVPNILVSTSQQLDKIKQEFRAADGKMNSMIQTMDGNMSELIQTVSTFDFRIQSAEQSVATMTLSLKGFETRILQAESEVDSFSSSISQLSSKISLVVTETADGDKVNSTSIIMAINDDGSTLKLNANKIDITSVTANAAAEVAQGLALTATDGDKSSTIKLTYSGIRVDSATVDFSGMVSFTDLENEGSTVINGANITTGKIAAEYIETESLACTAVYAKDYPDGHYFALNGDWGDFGIFSPNADSTDDPRDESCVFGAFHSDMKAVNFYSFGNNFMGFNATTSNTLFAKGNWNFTSACFTGTLDFSTATNIIYPETTSVVAVFGE
ncbi:MAG: phage tail protein [Clostridia bacterium]|nr:phage tail protein [Clostridia bacterium]